MPGYVKAGKILRVLGWVQLVVAAGALLFVLAMLATPSMKPDQRTVVLTIGLIVTAITALGGWLHLLIGKASIEHKDWARAAGIVVGVLSLPGFPVGTLLGGFVIYFLVSGWETSPPPPAA